MANTIVTHQMMARRAVKRFSEDTFIKTINTGRSDEFAESVNGYKKGESVDIAVPAVPVVYDGEVFAGGGTAADFDEKKVRLTLDTTKHVALSFTAKQLTLDIDEFDERVIKPAVQSLVSIIQADLLTRMKDATPNVVGTWGTIPTTGKVYGQARASLNRFLAPPDMRSVQFSSDANLELATANSTLFHASKEIEDIYKEGSIGDFAGFTFFENQSLPMHTNGAGTGYLVAGAGQTGALLAVDTGAGALTKGTIFTLAGVFAVHPITGLSLGVLRQFVVTANYAGGAGNVPIYPAIIPTSASVVGTVTNSPADNAPMTVFGDVSEAARQDLAYHKDAFTAAFAPKKVLASCEGYTALAKGVSLRVMKFGDGKADQEHTRLDALYGFAATRPDHSSRVSE